MRGIRCSVRVSNIPGLREEASETRNLSNEMLETRSIDEDSEISGRFHLKSFISRLKPNYSALNFIKISKTFFQGENISNVYIFHAVGTFYNAFCWGLDGGRDGVQRGTKDSTARERKINYPTLF